MIKNIAFPVLVVLFLLAVNVQAFSYEITYFDNSVSGANVETDPVSFRSDDADSIIFSQSLNLIFNVSTPPDSYSATYESPFGTAFGISSGDLSLNFSCLNVGTANKEYTQDNAEGRNTITQDGSTNSFITTSNRFLVTNANRYLNVSTPQGDSEGFAYSLYYLNGVHAGATPSNSDITDNLNSDNFGICDILSVARATTPTITVPAGNEREFSYLIFNSTAGNTSWTIDLGSALTLGARGILYKFSDLTIIDSDTAASGNAFSWSDNAILDENTLYVLGVGWEHGSVATIDAPYILALVDTGLADYDCPEFGECSDDTGTQTRTCIDSNGLQPDLIEIRSCTFIVIENVTLGFEEFTPTSDILKCEAQWLFGCSYVISNVSLDRPTNWSIIDPAYGGANFLQMTQEYATEGTRSLKMWQIPPKQGEVLTNTTCGNLTSSVIPQVFQEVSNDTFSVSFNVTFPATNMQLAFDTKKCTEQVVQHTALTGLFNISLCPANCYSQECDTEPRGRYAFNVVDTTTSLSIFGAAQYLDAVEVTDSPLFTLSDLGIVPGRTYNIVFAISNENPNDATGNCLYVDNVRYLVTEQALEEIVPGCASRCIGTTRIEATRTQSNSCFTITREFSPLCLDSETAEAVENAEDFCSDTNTLQSFNEKTGKYEPIDCSETGRLCSEGRCITEEEAQEGATTPTDGETLTNELIEAASSRFFWAIVFILIIMTITTVGIAQMTGDGKAAFMMGAIGGIIMFVFFGAILWIPIEWVALFVLVVGLIIVYELRKVIT